MKLRIALAVVASVAVLAWFHHTSPSTAQMNNIIQLHQTGAIQ